MQPKGSSAAAFGSNQGEVFKEMLANGVVCIHLDTWLHRNDRIFNQGKLDFDKVIELVKLRVWIWNNSLVKKGCFSYSNWCINPLVCLRSRSSL